MLTITKMLQYNDSDQRRLLNTSPNLLHVLAKFEHPICVETQKQLSTYSTEGSSRKFLLVQDCICTFCDFICVYKPLMVFCFFINKIIFETVLLAYLFCSVSLQFC